MTIVTDNTITDSYTQAGKRDIVHVFVDHLGKVVQVLKRVPSAWTTVERDADRAEIKTRIESQFAENEISDFLSQIQTGKNPFRDELNNPIDPQYQTRNTAIKKILQYIGNLEPDDAINYRLAFQHLSNLSQVQVEALGFSWVQYQNWLTQVDALRTAAINHIKLGGV